MWEKKLAADGSDGGNCADTDQVNRDVRCVNNRYTWTTEIGSGNERDPNGTDFLARLNNTAATWPTPPNASNAPFAGHTNWRIPTVWELQTLLFEPYPCSISPCIIDPMFVPTSIIRTPYWTSTSNPDGPSVYFAWYVSFIDGFVSGGASKHENFFVRAVRGGL